MWNKMTSEWERTNSKHERCVSWKAIVSTKHAARYWLRRHFGTSGQVPYVKPFMRLLALQSKLDAWGDGGKIRSSTTKKSYVPRQSSWVPNKTKQCNGNEAHAQLLRVARFVWSIFDAVRPVRNLCGIPYYKQHVIDVIATLQKTFAEPKSFRKPWNYSRHLVWIWGGIIGSFIETFCMKLHVRNLGLRKLPRDSPESICTGSLKYQL